MNDWPRIALILLLILPVMAWVTMRLLRYWLVDSGSSSSDLSYQEALRRIDQITALPLNIARSRAECLLKNARRFRTAPYQGGHSDLLSALPPLVRELFQQYDVISTRGGSAAVGPVHLHETEIPDLIEIGGSEDSPAFVRRMDETILEGWIERGEDLDTAAPTVYHWLLLVDDSFNGPFEERA